MVAIPLDTIATRTVSVRGRNVAIAWLLFAMAILVTPFFFVRGLDYSSSSDLHAAMEIVGALLGLAAGFSFALRYYAIGNRLLLFIGLAYIVNGAEDFAHGVLAFRHLAGLLGVEPSTLKQFIPGTYVTGRILFGLMMIGAPLLALRTNLRGTENRGHVTLMHSTIAAVVTIAGTVVAFMTPLPQFVFPDLTISRPVDLLSGAIIGAAFLLFLLEYRRTGTQLLFWIAISLGVNTVGQIVMVRSTSLFDAAFDVAHVYKIVGYLVPMIAFAVLQIAELRRAEGFTTELWESLDSYTLLLITDSEANVRYANEGFCVASGMSTDSLLGTRLPVLPQNDEQPFEEVWGELRAGRVWREEVELQRVDGNPFFADVTIVPQCDEHGELQRCITLLFDIGEKKRLETRLNQTQKLEAIGQLAAGIAHEINTPMQFIGDNIEYLNDCSDKLFQVIDEYREALHEEGPPEAWVERRERLEQLSQECRFNHLRENVPLAISESREGIERTIKIVRAMKDFSHPGAKEMTSTSLNDLIESTIAISRNRWKYAAKLEAELSSDLPDAPMLASEMNQVLLNLIVNASDAIAEKNRDQEGALGTITVRTYADEDQVVLEVQDDGCGMPDEVKAKAFDQFYTTKEVGKGTGQGLSIAYDVVVNMHQGDIDIVTEPGKGTTFMIWLPRHNTAELLDPLSGDAEPQLAGVSAG